MATETSTPSDDEIVEAVRIIHEEQPDLGRAEIRTILKDENQGQISEAKLKRLVPLISQPSIPEQSGIPHGGSQSAIGDVGLGDRLSAMHFWLNQAHKNANARTLAAVLWLDLPGGNPLGFKAGLKYPIRRLVITGKDTPENFRILFGVDSIPDIHAETRKEVLMSFGVQDGSPTQTLDSFLDHGCPYWAPRPANAAEEEEIRQQLESNKHFAAILRS